MENNYTVHRLGKDDFDLLVPLMKDAFGTDVNVEYFRWKYMDNPAGFVHGYYALDQHGEIAAYYGVIPEIYYLDGQETIIHQSCDTMTHSGHRRRGLFQLLAVRCYEALRENGTIFVIGFGGPKSTPGLLKFGWKPIFKVRHYLYPGILANLRLNRSQQGVQESTREHVAGIVQALPIANGVRVSKRADMFAWRTSNPKYQYQFIAYGKEGQSYLVYYFHQDKAIIFDFHFANHRARRRLMNYMKNLVLRKKLRGMAHFCQERSPYSRALKSSGFLANPFSKGPAAYVVNLTILADDETWAHYGRESCWNLNAYDHDAL